MNNKKDFFQILHKYLETEKIAPLFLSVLFEAIIKQDCKDFVLGYQTDDGYREDLNESVLQKLYSNNRKIAKTTANRIITFLDRDNFIFYLKQNIFPKECVNQMKIDFECPNIDDDDFYNHITELFIYFIKFDISPSASPLPRLFREKNQASSIILTYMTIDELNNMESEGEFKEIWVVTQYLSHEYDEMIDRASMIVPKNMIKDTTYTYFVPISTPSRTEEEFRAHCKRKGVTDRKKLEIIRVPPEFDDNNYIGFPILWGYQIYEPSSSPPKRKGYQAHWFDNMDGYRIFQLHDDIVDIIVEKLRKLKN